MVKIAVLGAGVVGLSTALRILEECDTLLSGVQHVLDAEKTERTVDVTVLADRLMSETTSHGVPGLFRPNHRLAPGIPHQLFKEWLELSWSRFDSLVHSVDCERAGLQIVSGYQFTDNEEVNDVEKDLVYQYRPLTTRELNMFPNILNKHGRFTTTLTVEPAKYLKYLTEQIRKRGGKIVQCRKVESLEELAGMYDIVVNCAGLGSRELVDDRQLIARRGYLIKMKAPWIKHFLFVGSDALTYVIPGQEVLHVGGVRTDNDMESRVRTEERERILADVYKVLPSLQRAEIVHEFVGWRPHREPLRLHSQSLHFTSKQTLQVVHNYGHGGLGVTLSWGTAVHAARLVISHIKDKQREQSVSASKL